MMVLPAACIDDLRKIQQFYDTKEEGNRLLANQLLIGEFPLIKQLLPTDSQMSKVYTMRKRQNFINKFIALVASHGIAVCFHIYLVAETCFEANFAYWSKYTGIDCGIFEYPSEEYLKEFLPFYHRIYIES